MKAVGWMTLAAGAAAAPGALAPIGGRVLTIALLPASGVAALLMARGVAAVRSGAMCYWRSSTTLYFSVGALVGVPSMVRVLPSADTE